MSPALTPRPPFACVQSNEYELHHALEAATKSGSAAAIPPLAGGEVIPPALPEEDAVKAVWFGATISRDNGDGSFVIRYDDGDGEDALDAALIRRAGDTRSRGGSMFWVGEAVEVRLEELDAESDGISEDGRPFEYVLLDGLQAELNAAYGAERGAWEGGRDRGREQGEVGGWARRQAPLSAGPSPDAASQPGAGYGSVARTQKPGPAANGVWAGPTDSPSDGGDWKSSDSDEPV